MSKEWKQDKRLYKYGDIEVELECIRLCDQCGIPVESEQKVFAKRANTILRMLDSESA